MKIEKDEDERQFEQKTTIIALSCLTSPRLQSSSLVSATEEKYLLAASERERIARLVIV